MITKNRVGGTIVLPSWPDISLLNRTLIYIEMELTVDVGGVTTDATPWTNSKGVSGVTASTGSVWRHLATVCAVVGTAAVSDSKGLVDGTGSCGARENDFTPYYENTVSPLILHFQCSMRKL